MSTSTQNPDGTTTYENDMVVPKFNLMSLDLATIENELEYLLFVEHGESMEGYTHLQPLIEEVAKRVVTIADRAVAEFQRDMTSRIAKHLQETIGTEIANIVYDAQVNTQKKVVVKTTIDDEKVVSQTVEPHRDW